MSLGLPLFPTPADRPAGPRPGPLPDADPSRLVDTFGRLHDNLRVSVTSSSRSKRSRTSSASRPALASERSG